MRPKQPLKPVLATFLALFGLVLIPIILKPLLIFALIGGIAVLFFFILRSNRTTRIRQTAWRKASSVIHNNLDHLTRRRAQLVRQDPYGRPLFDKWTKEVEYFIEHHISLALAPEEHQHLQSQRLELVGLVNQLTYLRMQEEPVFRAFSDDMTPSEFELFCAEQLRLAGWDAQVTMRSRDQGVDVVAEKSRRRIVLQCKLYSGPVGNGAVQEIAAGRAYEHAHFGAVVTNSRYTAPAEQLAVANGILLLHYRDLANLDAMLSDRAA